MIQNAGTQYTTADVVVGASGEPVRIFMMHIISGASAAVVSLRNGTSTGGTAYITETGTANTGKTIYYGTQGVFFPAGCFIDVDGNTTSSLVTFNYAY